MRSLMLILVLLFCSSCGKARASAPATAEVIAGQPSPGVTCYAILNGSGEVVGGSCIGGGP
jgi:uncharacterized membrane protein YphA (DoxX/SURF4 family)